MDNSSKLTQRPWFSRVFPFALYMAFIAIESILSFLAEHFPLLATIAEQDQYILYPVKTVLIAASILFFWKGYTEIRGVKGPGLKDIALSVAAGIVVFILWINMDWDMATMGSAEGFNPYFFGGGIAAWATISFRLFGASVVVPIFEELFWRSFLIRYIIDNDFLKVRLGAFSWPSFLLTVLFFGLEHNMWLAGIMAGIVYNLLLYRTRSLTCCIVSHGVTNLLLGVYVLNTGNWQFW